MSHLWRFAWVNSCVKNSVLPPSLALLKTLVVLRWLMWPIAQGRGRSRSLPEYYSCKEIRHIAKHCNKKFCNYCKKKGHIIKDFRVRPQIDPLLLFILLFSPLLCLHLPLSLLFRVLLPTLLLSRLNRWLFPPFLLLVSKVINISLLLRV